MRFFLTYLTMTLLAVFCCNQLGAQQRVRIAGLENNVDYQILVTQEEKLLAVSDSISSAMNDIRRSFRTDTLNRAANSVAILRMEEEMFDLRNRMARMAGQINSIEQGWILRSLHAGEQTEDTIQVATPAVKERLVANFVYNSYFDRNMGADECRDLRKAQDSEIIIPALIEQYAENNHRLRVLRHAYNLSIMADTAGEIKTRFDSLARVNAAVEKSIATGWETIFDLKSYNYSYLMDKESRNDLLLRFESDMEEMRREQSKYQGVFASDEIVKYVLQKRLLTTYEIILAQELSNQKAVDSLKRVEAGLLQADMLNLEPVKLKERLFLDYSDIKINPSSPYNARNPIPEVVIYPKGIIYRVLLGTYSSAQQPSVFRNISPIAVQKGSDNKYRYFAGGFPSDSTVNVAVEQMKKRGFKRPEAVVWLDGVYVNTVSGKGFGSGFFRVELSGLHELTPEIEAMIRTVTGGKDIVRGENMFIVGPLDNANETVRLRLALERENPALEIKISEISE